MIRQKAFTLIEFLITISIIFVLLGITAFHFRFFREKLDLQSLAENIVQTLKLAQSKTLASEREDKWGVYFDTSIFPHRYIIFKGENYPSPYPNLEEIYNLPPTIEISEINLGGENKIIFNRILGTTTASGTISLRLKNKPLETRTIFIEKSGLIGLTPSTFSEENLLKDSRHVHFNYSREISLSTESLILTFSLDGKTVVKEVPIFENVKAGNFSWEGEIIIANKNQKIKIHTHKLNETALGTIFCVHRDRRYNTAGLKIEISGDTTGNLIEYNPQGQTKKGTSIYVSEPYWQ